MSVTVTVSSATLLEEGPKVLLLLLLLPPKTHPRNCKKLSFLFFMLSSLENAPVALCSLPQPTNYQIEILILI